MRRGLFPLLAYLIPPCHPTGTAAEHPSTGKRQSCGPCISESNSASQSGLLLERYKRRMSSLHSGTAMLTSHTTWYNVRSSCWGLAFRQHTVLFLFSSGGCCSVVPVLIWDLFPFPASGVFRSWFICLLFHIWHFELLYLPFWHPHWY